MHVAHAHRVRGYRWADDEAAFEAMRRKVPESVGGCFELIEQAYLAGPWVMGASYTICDPYLFTLTQWLPGDGVAIERFPKVQAHHAAMRERQAVQQALAEEAG